MSGAQDLTRDVDIDLSGLIAELRRKWWLILGVALVTGAGVFLYFSAIEPSYRSNARVIIEKRESVFTRRSGADTTVVSNQFDEQGIGSQVEILASDDLALKVIRKLDLVNNPEFRGGEPSLLHRVFALAGLSGGVGTEISPEELALIEFRSRRSVFAIENSRVISIEFWAHDRNLAYEVPNAIADAYLALTKASELESTEAATEWLGPEIEELRTKVRQAEAKVAEYRATSDILVGSDNSLLATRQLSEISSELSRVKSQRSSAEAQVAAIRSALENGGSLDVIPEVINSPLIQRFREQEVALQAQISELSTTLLSNHPRLKALQSQSEDFARQIRNAAANILKSLENNVDLLRTQETALAQEVNRLKAEASRVGEAEVELRALEREANAQRELLESYLTQYREAASRTNREYLPVDARIISRAVRPADSYYPKVIPFTVAGTAMALVLTLVGILGHALLAGRAFKLAGPLEPSYIPERVEVPPVQEANAETKSPVGHSRHAAGLPEVPWREESAGRGQVSATSSSGLRQADVPALQPEVDEIEPDPGSLASAAANDPEVFPLAETARAIASLGRARILAISPGGDMGSVISWALARKLAAGGKSVILLDLTGSGVTTAEFLGTQDRTGIAEFLGGTASFENAVHKDARSNVDVMPIGLSTDPGPDPIGRLASLAGDLSAKYDFAVFDCGFAGAEGLLSISDSETIVLISAEGASRHEVRMAEAELLECGFSDAVVVRLTASGKAAKSSFAAA
jgi:exopolysaccharide transport family protein